MNRILIATIVSLMIVFTAAAQFNDSTHYYLKYGTTGIINRTNDARSFVLNNVLGFQLKKEKVSFYSNNAWVYGRNNIQLTNNDFSSTLHADWLKDQQKLYYWALATFTTSYSLKINHQFQTGAGVGYNIINRPKAELVVSDGVLYETSDLQLPSGEKDVYQTVRNSLRIKHRWDVNGMVVWEGTHFWQPSFLRIDDYIIQSKTSLSVKLRKWLSLTGALTYNKLNRTKRENLLITFGLTAETYF